VTVSVKRGKFLSIIVQITLKQSRKTLYSPEYDQSKNIISPIKRKTNIIIP